jgi:dienelactone hydrolase
VGTIVSVITKRARSWLRRGTTVVVALIVFGLVAGTWVTASEFEDALLRTVPDPPSYDVEVKAVSASTVTLSRTPESTRVGVWGLDWETGYARVGAVLRSDADGVTRTLQEVRGVLRPGTRAAVDRFAFDSTPASLGLGFTEVAFEGPLGEYPAWSVDGSDDTWVVFVHGREAARREALRALGTVAGMGFPALVIAYRTDPVAPGEPGGRSGLGRAEWPDLEAAVEYAVASGAADVVLVGYGTGATAAAMMMHESEWSARVVGMVFDAPVLDAGAIADRVAARRRVPGFVVAMAKGLAGLRFGIDWGRIDQVRRAGEFEEIEVPILLFHGDADDEVPVATSDAFAASLPELVTYERVAGGAAGASWNADPDRYADSLTAFLADVALGPSEFEPPVEGEDAVPEPAGDGEEVFSPSGGA